MMHVRSTVDDVHAATRLPLPAFERLKRAALAGDRSIAATLRRLVMEALDQLDEPKAKAAPTTTAA